MSTTKDLNDKTIEEECDKICKSLNEYYKTHPKFKVENPLSINEILSLQYDTISINLSNENEDSKLTVEEYAKRHNLAVFPEKDVLFKKDIEKLPYYKTRKFKVDNSEITSLREINLSVTKIDCVSRRKSI